MNIQPHLVSRISKHVAFQTLAMPIGASSQHSVVDATFYLHKDGFLVNAEGWHHPEGFLIGEVLYAPDEHGDKQIFGIPYRKVTLYPGTHTPVPYSERSRLLAEINPVLSQCEANPFFAKYKQILPLSDFIAYFPSERALQQIVQEEAVRSQEIAEDLECLNELLGREVSTVRKGLTGRLALGQTTGYHDFDIVFAGSLQRNREIAERMRYLIRSQAVAPCFEGGKAWQVRFFDSRHKLMCCFFHYEDPCLAPLRHFSMNMIEEDVILEGTVANDLHSMYTPTILKIQDVHIVDTRASTHLQQLCSSKENVTVVAYHTATRGECYVGDRILVKGALVNLHTKENSSELAICVIDREGIRNLTPPWDNYYG